MCHWAASSVVGSVRPDLCWSRRRRPEFRQTECWQNARLDSQRDCSPGKKPRQEQQHSCYQLVARGGPPSETLEPPLHLFGEFLGTRRRRTICLFLLVRRWCHRTGFVRVCREAVRSPSEKIHSH